MGRNGLTAVFSSERVRGITVHAVSMVTSITATIHATVIEADSPITETGPTIGTEMDAVGTAATGDAVIADAVMTADVAEIADVVAIAAEIVVEMAGTGTENRLNRLADKLPQVRNANMGRFVWT